MLMTLQSVMDINIGIIIFAYMHFKYFFLIDLHVHYLAQHNVRYRYKSYWVLNYAENHGIFSILERFREVIFTFYFYSR